MNFKHITYKNKELKRINYRKVNNILQDYKNNIGLVIYIAPINMRIDDTSYWTSPFELELNNNMDYTDYINYIIECRYYNCVDELGKYLKFYIEM